MDHAKAKAKGPPIIRTAVIATVVLIMISGGVVLANIDFSGHRVDREKLSIAVVQRGTMEIKVSADGQLLSKNIEQLSAQVSGRVGVKDIKPGGVVHVGQLLVELTNPDLTAGADEAQSAWESAVAELQATNAELQNNILNQEVAVSRTQLDLAKAQLKANDDRALGADGVIPLMQLKRSELDLTQLSNASGIEESHLQKLRGNVEAQLAVKRFLVTELARALDRAKVQAGDLKIIAGISGIVQAIDVEVGQEVQPGGSIGRIAQQDQLYVELKVPAREASQVQAGQSVVIDTRNGTVNGIVTRVDPGVTDGTVIVDADLQAGELPAGARPQLQVEGVIYISRLPNTLYVGKPSYVKNDSEIMVYKLDQRGQYATRVPIKAGKVSLNYLQVLQGLEAGDRIITSEVGSFQNYDRIVLK